MSAPLRCVCLVVMDGWGIAPPDGQTGNSEVGHLTLGAGATVIGRC